MVLIAVVFVLTRNRSVVAPHRGEAPAADTERSTELDRRDRGRDRDREPPTDAASEPPPPSHNIKVQSDWDRLRLRTESEFLRLFRGGDRAAVNRLTSRTLRGALEEIGIGRERIDERPGAAAAAGVGRAAVQWIIQVPPRASLFRINDAVTQSILVLGGHVLSGVERPARIAGTALDLRVGFGDRITHAILVEPNPTLADVGTQMAFVVLGLDRDIESVFRAYAESPVPFTIAIRPDQSNAGRAARELRAARREVFLHLPMEPRGYPNLDPGKNAILLDLSRVEIEDRIRKSLDALGQPPGIITRMGSAAVNDPDVMRAVLGEVKRRNLLFIDAHGAGPSVVEETGEAIGARTLTLGGMLESGGSTAAVRTRLRQLEETARQRGSLVVGIKASAQVLSVLESERENLGRQGIEIVPASRLVL